MKMKDVTPYEEGREKLLGYMSKKTLKHEDRLPSERILCEKWSMNRETLRKAIYSLNLEDKIYSVRGSGNYVKKEKVKRNLADLESLTEWAQSKGFSVSSKVVSSKVIEANKKISQKLCLKLGEKVFSLIRCRYLNNVPLAIEYVYLPYIRFRNIEAFDFERESLYCILEEQYGIFLEHGDESIGITYVDEFESPFLEVEEGTAAFFTLGIVYDINQNPTEYCKTVTRYDKLTFSFSSGK